MTEDGANLLHILSYFGGTNFSFFPKIEHLKTVFLPMTHVDK